MEVVRVLAVIPVLFVAASYQQQRQQGEIFHSFISTMTR
jgi:hypothetical protein